MGRAVCLGGLGAVSDSFNHTGLILSEKPNKEQPTTSLHVIPDDVDASGCQLTYQNRVACASVYVWKGSIADLRKEQGMVPRSMLSYSAQK